MFTITVTVADAGGQTTAATSMATVLSPYPATVSGLSATSGPAAGGTVLTISGSGFTGATAVDFGSTPAVSFTVVSDTLIAATVPPGTPGQTVQVTVTTPSGTSTTAAADQFSYNFLTPSVTGLNPTSGPATGGTVVQIFGTGFAGTTQVSFGSARPPRSPSCPRRRLPPRPRRGPAARRSLSP